MPLTVGGVKDPTTDAGFVLDGGVAFVGAISDTAELDPVAEVACLADE